MIERIWKFLDDDSAGGVEDLAQAAGVSKLTAKLVWNRGVKTAQELDAFFGADLKNLPNPSQIAGIEVAAARLAEAREKGESVVLFGDYDVDGTTGAALLLWVLRDLGFRVSATQPDRFKDGYGLNEGAVIQAHATGASVLVSIDCGITAFGPAARARELGVDLIIVDHHQLERDTDGKGRLPDAFAIINPHQPACVSGLKELCGCALAFMLAVGLRALGRAKGWFTTRPEPNLKSHLDLVTLATAADLVPLTGVNRILIRQGLEVLRHSKKPGLQAMLRNSKLLERDLSMSHLGFTLGPRINASGRVENAQIALELLTTEDAPRAEVLARKIEALNEERMALQNQIWDQVRHEVELGIAQGRYKNAVVVASPAWHEGVVGIVASRVTETFKRPAIVIAIRADGLGKGSVRSFAGKNVLEALRTCAPLLSGFGGHAHAAGISVREELILDFARAFDDAIACLPEESRQRVLWIDEDVEIGALDVRTLLEIERLAPFGPGNPEPIIRVRAEIADHRILKERHAKLSLTDAIQSMDGTEPGEIEAIWFYGREREDLMKFVTADESAQADFVGVPELNRFKGRVTPNFRVKDFKPVGDLLC